MPKQKSKPSDCCDDAPFPNYQREIKNLNRIKGQVEGLVGMIEQNRYCPDILIQISAVRAALKAVETRVLETHLKNCVMDSFQGGTKAERDKKIVELMQIFEKRLS